MKSLVEILFKCLDFSVVVWHEEENKEINIPLKLI
jgi:hypothetical protein